MSASDELTVDPAAAAPPIAPAARTAALRARAYELARFLSVGGVAFVVDLGLFNLLRFGPGHLLEHKPLTAKVISVIAATLVSWVGNRHWTFSRQRTDRPTRELVVFTAINLVGAVVPVLTLALSHYALNLTNAFADNAATVIGIGIGTALRYIGYKRWVFTGPR
ncbi:GtrA family protein [Cellulomonas sp. ICMP 17802]|uniref:GtrA family protein n=1 Tax=Cellulomonas sp. ICMP 17802 TaxID=3239199 RepID=UPI00351B490C